MSNLSPKGFTLKSLHEKDNLITELREQIAEDNENLLHASGVIIELREQVAALTKVRDGAVAILEQTLVGISFGELRKAYAAYRAGEKYPTVLDKLEALLAASQVREAKLREALQYCAVQPGYLSAHHNAQHCHAQNALNSIPTDDTALRERLAEERERCADRVGDREIFGGAATVIRSMK